MGRTSITRIDWRIALKLASLSLFVALAGCGGGGGGSSDANTAEAGATGSGSSAGSLPSGGAGGGTGGGSTGGGPVQITQTTPTNYVWADLATNMPVYVDRNYTFVDVPQSVQGMRYLQTANSDKAVSNPSAIQFDIDQNVTVYVAYDSRTASLPSWLQSWTDAGMRLITSDTDFEMYQREFPAGTVTLGGNESASSMYSVIVATDGGGGATGGPVSISGTPATNITEGMAYSFVPTVSGGTGNWTLSIQNKPAWASFNSSTGALTGTPGIGDVGMTFSDIVISVSDGSSNDSLSAFSIDVAASGSGSATLSWTAPTQNQDNSQLDDLAGYRIYYGTSQGNYPNSKTISNPGVTMGMVENLAPGTWSFVVTAYDYFGNESGYSNVTTKTISAP